LTSPEKVSFPSSFLAWGFVETGREHILATILEMGRRIEARNGAAQLLEMNPSTLRYRMKKLGIKRHSL